MWQFIRSSMLTVIIFIGAAHGILVVGPKSIRANQDYTVVLSNFNPHLSKVELMLRMEGHTDDGRSVLNVTKAFDVRKNMNSMAHFNMPADLVAGSYQMTLGRRHDSYFRKIAELEYLNKTISGLIQHDKPVYKPGDTVKFRVIVLDSELKPPARVESVHVIISDSQNHVIREWLSAQLDTGMFEGDLPIAPTPMLGVWNISVRMGGEELASKTFEVKEHVLYSFDVEVKPSSIALEEHQGVNLTIAAFDHLGTPVKGLAKVELYLENGVLDQTKEIPVYRVRQVELRMRNELKLYRDQHSVRVKTTFVEQHTNGTVVNDSEIPVYKYRYRVELMNPYFHPGLPFKSVLQFRHHDGTPAKGIPGKVEVMDVGYNTVTSSDDDGLIMVELNPSENVTDMEIRFSNDNDGFFFNERMHKVDDEAETHIKLELRSPVALHGSLKFLVTCNNSMTFLMYYVVSKGNIIDSGSTELNDEYKYSLRLNTTELMIPKAKVIVVAVASSAMVFDFVDIDFKELPYVPYGYSLNENEVKPEQPINPRMSGRSSAYYKNSHELLWEDIMPLYNAFYAVEEDEFDEFHSMGLFGRSFR